MGNLPRRHAPIPIPRLVAGLAAALALVVSLPGCGSRKLGPWDQIPSGFGLLLRNVERDVPPLLEEHEVPGLAVAVLREGSLNASRGFGVLQAGGEEPVTEQTVFEAASLSKPVFAYAVMTLVQEGRLDLDRPLVSYMERPFEPVEPKFMAAPGDRSDPRLGSITPRMVLSHRSGLPNWSFGRKLELVGEPGGGFGYSGEAYVYLQRVVEEITGMPINDFITRTVFEPLGMDSSSYRWEERFEGRAAAAHDRSGRADPERRSTVPLVSSTLYTTAADYARFLLVMLDPAKGKKGHLAPELIREMLKPATDLGDGLSWGLGWALEETNRGLNFWHWGDNGEFKAFTMVNVDSQSGVAVFTNSAHGFKACAPVVRRVLSGDHPALSFRMVEY